MENKMKKTINEIRRITGLSQTEFGKRLGGIPLRTIQNWESGERTPPEWVVELIAFRVENDKELAAQKVLGYDQVVTYARESNHAGAGESLEMQKAKLRAFCEKNNYVVVDEVATIGNRQDSMCALKEAIERAKNTESKTLFMASTNRVVGTHKEITEVTDLIESAGVTIATMDGSFEYIQKYGVSFESLIASTIAAIDEETDDE